MPIFYGLLDFFDYRVAEIDLFGQCSGIIRFGFIAFARVLIILQNLSWTLSWTQNWEK